MFARIKEYTVSYPVSFSKMARNPKEAIARTVPDYRRQHTLFRIGIRSHGRHYPR